MATGTSSAKNKTKSYKSTSETSGNRLAGVRNVVRTFTDADADPLKLQLLDDLNRVLTAYESQRAQLLQKAFDEGGVERVQQLETEYNAIQSAYFELLNRALAVNGGQYADLMNQAIQVTQAVKAKIEQLQGVADIINNIASAVNLIGRVILLFGL